MVQTPGVERIDQSLHDVRLSHDLLEVTGTPLAREDLVAHGEKDWCDRAGILFIKGFGVSRAPTRIVWPRTHPPLQPHRAPAEGERRGSTSCIATTGPIRLRPRRPCCPLDALRGWQLAPAFPRHSLPLLPLLPSGPDGVHNVTMRGDRCEPPSTSAPRGDPPMISQPSRAPGSPPRATNRGNRGWVYTPRPAAHRSDRARL